MLKVGIIGFGNMGKAIALGARTLFEVSVFDKDKEKLIDCQGLKAQTQVADLINSSDCIILAVKPQDIESVLKEIKANYKEQLIISIAAGITTKYIIRQLTEKARVIRIMPNMPAQINQGVSFLYKHESTTEKDLNLAWQLFSCVGFVMVVSDEKMINAATAVSGSGPAFFCHYIKEKANATLKREEFIQMLADAAVGLGFDQQEAKVISEKTIDGTIAILEKNNLSPKKLIKMVASKGGTTQAGLAVLVKGGSIEEAVKAALLRAEELGQDTPRL